MDSPQLTLPKRGFNLPALLPAGSRYSILVCIPFVHRTFLRCTFQGGVKWGCLLVRLNKGTKRPLSKINSILEFLVIAHEVNRHGDVGAALKKAVNAYNFKHFGLYRIMAFDNAMLPEPIWQVLPPEAFEHYLDKEYYRLDPTMLYLETAETPYSWETAYQAVDSAHPHYSQIKTLRTEAINRGLVSGFCLPVFRREGLVANMWIASDVRIELSPFELTLFSTAAHVAYHCHLKFGPATRSRIPRGSGKKVLLSDREKSILSRLAEGMTSVEIGRAIGISNHTVDWYVNGLQEKLDARNRQNLIASAFRIGLIS
ncbi:LuxR family transcriptional regulator [Martelella alba]|uniref:LuxR family transcriptional regulator n=1 Tax=Martelella alba TaxID=2590451 RepID=A0A506U5W2_9HYPH|nr:LuxR family transcriptional regulator [Martelella alba]TPW28474.1 LuxR family transcriptional regulator [Martelella alba]